MTLNILNIDNQHQTFLSHILNGTTKDYKVITEPTSADHLSTSICTLGSSHYSFIRNFFKNHLPDVIKSQDGKIWMTIIFIGINDEFYYIRCLTYIPTSKGYERDTEKLKPWEKVTSYRPAESTIFAFIEGLFMYSPPTKIVSW